MEKTSKITLAEPAQSAVTIHAHHKQQQNIFRRGGYFILHFLEMCAVMCVSLGIFKALSVWAGSVIGYSKPIRQFPVLSTVVLAIWFTLIMIAWMRLRRHEWRPTLEMASTSMIAVIPVVSVGLLGIVPLSELTGLECGGACALMFVAMLFRLNHYTANHASHQQHVHAT